MSNVWDKRRQRWADYKNRNTWATWLEHCRGLEEPVLRRHASVSSNNRHRCESCFCCAALTILEERRAK